MTKLLFYEFAIGIIIISQWWTVSTINCPHYCRCFMNNHLRFVTCTNRVLVSMDLDIPRTVEWLQLSNNSIFGLKDYVFQDHGLEHIVVLELDHNHIESVGLDAFAGLTKLEVVDLRYNHLYHIIPYTFEMNPVLKQLHLGGNPLTFISHNEPFLFSQSLEVLDVSSCRLNFVTPALIVGLPSLNTLNISRNSIQEIDGLFEFMDNVKVIDISKTEIKCNEHASRLSSWGSNHSAHIIGYPCLSSRQIMSVEMTREIVDDPPSNKWIQHGRLVDPSESVEIEEPIEETDDETTTEKPVERVDITHPEDRDQIGTFNWVVWLAFVNGFASGVAVAGSSIVCWIYCVRRRKSMLLRRRRFGVTTTSTSAMPYYCSVITPPTHAESMGLVDSPPPSYHELFHSA